MRRRGRSACAVLRNTVAAGQVHGESNSEIDQLQTKKGVLGQGCSEFTREAAAPLGC